jgi:hypothetical protein
MDGAIASVEIDGKMFLQVCSEKLEGYARKHIGEVLPVSVYGEPVDIVEHKRFFAILRQYVNNSEQYTVNNWRDEEQAVENLRLSLAYSIGYTKTIIDMKGKERTIPRSLDYNTPESEKRAFREASYPLLAAGLGVTVRELFLMGTR